LDLKKLFGCAGQAALITASAQGQGQVITPGLFQFGDRRVFADFSHPD
jgi:hypothetical protein